MAHKFDDDDERRPHRHAKPAKHSRNIPGKGMKILNDWQDDDFDDDFDDNVNVYEQITVSLIRKK